MATGRYIRFYNGFTEHEIASSEGLQKLGIEHIRPIVTRGHLIDVAGLKGRLLEAGEDLVADLRAAVSRQGLRDEDIRQGQRRAVPHRLGPFLDERQREIQRQRHRPRGRAMGR